ncbi:MAG: LPS-assembly protein LptD [Lentisphaeria bacterium]|jgi:LPS-assembly protein
MKHRVVLAVLAVAILFLFALTPSLSAQIKEILGDTSQMQIEADALEHSQQTGDARASGNVRIIYGNVTLTADEVLVNRETADFTATGKVLISLKDGSQWQAPAVKGNLRSHAFSFGPYRLDSAVWHSGGDGGENSAEGNQTLRNAWLSTCDCPEPHYRLSASSIKHRSDNRFFARNVVLRFGPVPVFYLPCLWGSTNANQFGYILRPGYSGKRGAYLQFGRVWKLGDEHSAKAYVDLMSKRGVGLGANYEQSNERRNVDLIVYGLHDTDTPETSDGFNRRFASRDDRYRVNYYHHERLADKLSLRLNLDLLSDIEMLEDWFRRDYRRFEQPKSYLDLSYDERWYSAGLALRPRLNEFYTVSETLPEIRLDIPRAQLGSLPLMYQSESKAGYHSMKWRNFALDREELLPFGVYDPDQHGDLDDYQSMRADTLHFVYLPFALRDRVTVTPRVGARVTYYSKSSKTPVSSEDIANNLVVDNPDMVYAANPVRNYDSDGGEITRFAFETGIEARTSISSDWLDLALPAWSVQGLRHVVEPYLNYTYASTPTEDRDFIYFFDEIDRLEKQNFLRLGLDQRLNTRRDGSVVSIARWQTYADIHFDRGEESDRYPGDLGNRLDFMPRRDLRFWGVLLHDMGEGEIHRGELGTRLGEEERLNFSLRYIYRNDHLSRSAWSMGSSLVDLTGESSYIKKMFETADIAAADLNVPINALTSVNIHAEYDFEKSRLSEHFYSLRRQLHCWVISLGMGWDNSDFRAMIMCHLTAFPKIKLDLDF